MLITRRSLVPAALLTAAIVAFLGFFALTAEAQTGVTETPRTNTMQVIDGEVLDSVVVGNRVIVVGTFTQVRDAGGSAINQPYIAAYNATSGRFDGTFRPDVDDFINAIDASGSSVFVVGQFSNVDGEFHRRIAKINANGSVDSAFQTNVGSTPNTLAVANNKVYIGGPFTVVNDTPREALAAVDVNSGALDSATNFDFEFSVQAGGGLNVRWLEVSPNGSQLWASHSARFIDGANRTGIARFDITNNTTTLNNWQTLLYDNELDRLGGALRMRRLAVSPGGDYVVQVTSGGDRPPAGDTAVRFPTNGGANVQPDWVSRHFDTVLGVAINDDVVFIGGHFQFQEAPGSDDPFPGDPNTNFGFGQGQGPLALGSQVVQREQLGALNPATGKSVDWNPGSDSFIGVQSLTWDDQLGLLVGHDGTRLGGVNNIGRHAIFPLGQTPNNGGGGNGGGGGGNGSLACTATFDGNNATISFTGDRGDSLQLRRNGSWAATVTGNSATINANQGDTITGRVRGPNYADPFQDITCTNGNGGGNGGGGGGNGSLACTTTFDGNNATINLTGDLGSSVNLLRNDNWVTTVTGNSATINANQGDTITGRVRGPNYADPFQDITCTNGNGGGNGGGGGGNGSLDTAISTPTNGSVVNAGTVTISGQSTAPDGVSQVRLTVIRNATGEYLNDDGTYSSEFSPLDIDFNGANTTQSWSIDVNLEFSGEHSITARTFDTNGTRDENVQRSFIVASAANEIPELAITSPSGSISTSTVQVSGTATDDIGVQSVSFAVRNRDTNEFFRLDGTLGASQSFTTTLSNPGEPFTNWTATLTGLPEGFWQITADAFDTSGQRDRLSRNFTQAGNNAPPTVEVTSGEGQRVNPNSRANFAGTAGASAGIDRVEVRLRNVVDFSGVQQNGSLGPQANFFTIPGVGGGTSTTWNYQSPQLPAGTYDATFRVIDEIGATSTVTTQIRVGAAGDDLPEITFTTNRFVQDTTSLNVVIGGTATDDNGVGQVSVTIFDSTRRVWLQPDGTTSNRPAPFFAQLTSPNATSTAWSYTFNAPSAGAYSFNVRAIDTAGQAAAAQIVGSFLGFPGDERPTTTIATPANGQTITNGRISASGTANDNSSISEVEVLLRNRDTGLFLRADGTMGSAQWINASLTNPGGDRTNWNYTSPALADGSWQVRARTFDNNGLSTASIPSVIVDLQ